MNLLYITWFFLKFFPCKWYLTYTSAKSSQHWLLVKCLLTRAPQSTHSSEKIKSGWSPMLRWKFHSDQVFGFVDQIQVQIVKWLFSREIFVIATIFFNETNPCFEAVSVSTETPQLNFSGLGELIFGHAGTGGADETQKIAITFFVKIAGDSLRTITLFCTWRNSAQASEASLGFERFFRGLMFFI